MTTLQVSRRLFTVHEYHLMAQAGILHEDDRVELIDGEIVEMAPIGSRHAAHVKRLIDMFHPQVRGAAIVGAQDPIRLGEHSEPQPDLTLLRPRPDFYEAAHPGPEDILLVIEIADTSLGYDRGVKVPLYARFDIAEAWVVDLTSERIELYRQPSEGQYQQTSHAARGDRISPHALPNVTLSVYDLLGLSV